MRDVTLAQEINHIKEQTDFLNYIEMDEYSRTQRDCMLSIRDSILLLAKVIQEKSTYSGI